MLFSSIIILLVLGITYMHYLRGAFTAAISLGCAFMATLLAFGYYENVVNLMGPGKFSDTGAGIVLIGIYVVSYIVLRVIFDSSIPGNLALPLYYERVMAAVFGFGAAILAGGVFAVGVQLLPLGPSVAGYSRFEIHDRDVIVPVQASGGRRAVDSGVQGEMVADTFDPAVAASMLLPVDGMVLSFVSLNSDGGYAGSQSFDDVHPDLRTEAFGNRLGVEHSGNRVILNTSKSKGVQLDGVYTLGPDVTGYDTEITDLRPNKTALTFKQKPGDGLIVLRLTFLDSATDKDGYVRLTPGAVRLHIDGTDYYPVGTMQDATTIGLDRVDDQIDVPMQAKTRGADFVFELPKTTLDQLTKGNMVPQSDAFVEAKLFGRMNLTGTKVDAYAGPGDTISVLRKAFTPLMTPHTAS